MALGAVLRYRACRCLLPSTPGASSALALRIREVQLGAGLLAGAPIKPSRFLAQGIVLIQPLRSPKQAALLFTLWVQMQSWELAWKKLQLLCLQFPCKVFFFSPTDIYIFFFVAKNTLQVT